MKQFLSLAAVFLSVGPAIAAETPPKPLIAGLKNPGAVAVGADGRAYVAVAGAVLAVAKDKAVPFATGPDDPRALAAFQQFLFVADKQSVWRIDGRGKAAVLAAAAAFPTPPAALAGIAVDAESGTVYVCDAGAPGGAAGAVYRIAPNGKVTVVLDAKRLPGSRTPAGLLTDGASHLLMTDSASGELHAVKVADGSTEKLAAGLGDAGGVTRDHYGRVFVADRKGGRVFVIPRPGDKPVLLAKGFQSAAGIGFDPTGKRVLVPDPKAGTLTAVPIVVPGAEVDERPLPVQTAVAFPDLKWTGWKPETDDGKPNPLRPLVLTHANDGSNRVFVATQHGVIHAFPNDQKATKTTVFLDLQDRVRYNDSTNEEGFLGLAFHPKYKDNGELFVFYTPKNAKLTNAVSRFKVRKDDPNRADPASEEELLRFTKPFWNHDGGTLCFGPDGYLYVTHGDGGAANDPFDNGQNLKSLLGKVHRIDVDRKDAGKNYAIPKDNPFVNREGARPEIWAYGLRNIWRMAFDRKTGKLWAADVGQNLFEEIDLIQRGGNYGWNRREGLHPFGVKGTGPRKDFVEPIWEYHHDIGKSITGGTVYRGGRIPELEGHYLYGDYVSARIWALRYDESKGRVVANRPIKDRGLPVYSFGEDEKGEVYLLTATRNGQGIYWFVK